MASKDSVSYRQLLSDVQAIEKELTRALKSAPPAAQELINLDLKQFEAVEGIVRACCMGVVFVGVRMLPPKPAGRGVAAKPGAKRSTKA